jgi:hypothetical protein
VPNLLRSAHFSVEHNVASGYIRIARSTAAFSTPEEAAAAIRLCDSSLAGLDLAALGLLLDWRLAPLSTDARLHQALVEATDAIAVRFARRAVLVETPVGKLQSGRVGRAHSSIRPEVFGDEGAALAYVTAADGG